ncbi:hypothetical protein [Brevibacillus borstelensis]|uniref:hypothetical protein n=1 Tax=Brevibacillus borstelensis TaxID=45462 RepID=UPI00203D6701|nr:hypothetical protein [Brevibacillus borstelensis]MCM3593085.1 hypothetical protein [Brevibacillus borstelensis]MCM3625155.1 hypothetical protein [Brevibacillus borstelensis]MED1853940.1 hypothetical protein [Brevibacillus borstelensis]MED1875314.1 hypothetical protein [Brevibacillus borstelensis]WNF05219.1 hypothetical protein RFB14_23185 [Brevibacillus borstelensis]
MKKWLLLAALFVLLWSSQLGQDYAGAAVESKKNLQKRQVIALFVEGLSFQDVERLRKYPHVDNWLRKAEAGALSIRSPGARSAANSYLLMGSGGQALYTDRSGTAYHPEEYLSKYETAGERMVEVSPPEVEPVARYRIVFPGIYRLQAENRDKPFTSRIGLLGETLARHNLSVISYGSGDYDDIRTRHAVLFAMDERGGVPFGNLSDKTAIQAPSYPYGVKTNYDYLLQSIDRETASGLISIQLADLARLYQVADDMAPERFAKQYEQVLKDLGGFLDRLLSSRKPGQMVMLLSPVPNQKAVQAKMLLPPVFVWKGGEAGLLTSATTRQSGLVSGLDILPTVLAFLQVSVPDGLAGHVMKKETGKGIGEFAYEVEQIHHIYANRSSVLYTYVMLQIVILAAAAALWVWGRGKSGESLQWGRRAMRLALLSMLWFPLLFLLEGLAGWRVSPPVILGVLILAAMAGAWLMEGRPLPAALAVVAGLTVALLLIDGWSGAPAMRRSYLGYDPVIGARFYGLGNEYEGVLIGCTILFAAALYQWSDSKTAEKAPGRENKSALWVIVPLFLLVLAYMAAPGWGADAGGFLAGLIGFAVVLIRLQGWRPGKKSLLLLAGGMLVGIALLASVSLLSSQPPTHITRVASQLLSGDWTEVMHIVERKLEMNLRLIRISVWSRVFVVSLLVLGLLALRSDKYLRHFASDYPLLVKGFSGVIAGSLAGLLLNDSGIITAATCIIYLVVPTLYTALCEPVEERYSSS